MFQRLYMSTYIACISGLSRSSTFISACQRMYVYMHLTKAATAVVMVVGFDCSLYPSCRCDAAAGGWQALYVFYHWIALTPKRRIWVDNGERGFHLPFSISNGRMEIMGSHVAYDLHEEQVSKRNLVACKL
jgi:hypothetical protein